ncbi:MAG: ABC transporter permease [Candidatus Izemoplasmatales bacterium]
MKRLTRMQIPYRVWMFLFIVIPTLILFVLALTNMNLYQIGAFDLTLDHFAIFSKNEIGIAFWNSFFYSSITTLICFLIGYPVAYYLSTLPNKTRKILVSLMIVPLWSNMLLRIVAWEKVFTADSYFTDLTGISLNLIGTQTAVIIGLVAMYLPFMIFPIFSVLEKMDRSLHEASKDLGATDFQTFVRVTFPLSSSGVISGVIMTMLPAMTSFVLPARLGLGTISLIGNVIESKFMKEVLGSSGMSINEGAVLSLFIMVLSVAAFMMITRVDKEGETLI